MRRDSSPLSIDYSQCPTPYRHCHAANKVEYWRNLIAASYPVSLVFTRSPTIPSWRMSVHTHRTCRKRRRAVPPCRDAQWQRSRLVVTQFGSDRRDAHTCVARQLQRAPAQQRAPAAGALALRFSQNHSCISFCDAGRALSFSVSTT